VSGSSLGGGTFWGLCRMLTNVASFEEVKELVSQGDNTHTDLLVGDIYGGDYEELGLKADVVASSFGKAGTSIELPTAEPVAPHFNKHDIVKSLLFMLTINIAQIAYLNAKQHGVQRVFFCGGFVKDSPMVWQKFSYAIDFWSKGQMKAMFLLHDGYLGALGSLLLGSSVEEDKKKKEEVIIKKEEVEKSKHEVEQKK